APTPSPPSGVLLFRRHRTGRRRRIGTREPMAFPRRPCVKSSAFSHANIRNQRGSRSAMVNRNLLRQYDLSDELQRELEAVLGSDGGDWLRAEEQEFRDHRIVTGRVRKIVGDDVLIDVGYKSEGAVELREWYDEALGRPVPPQVGDEVEVLL